MTQILTSVPSAARSTMQSEALKTAKEYEREAQRRIQHMNITAVDLDIRQVKKGGPHDEYMENNGLHASHRELRSK